MYMTPAYGMFKPDMQSRNNIEVIEVPCHEGFDPFIAENANDLVEMFNIALKNASERHVRVKAVLICNPCNPLGRCYSRATLIQISQFCVNHQLHLISDEIYAMSVFPSYGIAIGSQKQLDCFNSVLSVAQDAGMDNLHVLYGASKDWGLGGLRLGFLITSNTALKECCRRIA